MDEATLAALRQVLQGHPEIRLALLFGSRARGRGGPQSDIDIAIDSKGGFDLLALKRDLSLAVSAEVDVVDLARAGFVLLQAVLRDGAAIYQGERNALGSWRSRTIAELETDRPVWERMRNAFIKRLAARAHG